MRDRRAAAPCPFECPPGTSPWVWRQAAGEQRVLVRREKEHEREQVAASVRRLVVAGVAEREEQEEQGLRLLQALTTAEALEEQAGH